MSSFLQWGLWVFIFVFKLQHFVLMFSIKIYKHSLSWIIFLCKHSRSFASVLVHWWIYYLIWKGKLLKFIYSKHLFSLLFFCNWKHVDEQSNPRFIRVIFVWSNVTCDNFIVAWQEVVQVVVFAVIFLVIIENASLCI